MPGFGNSGGGSGFGGNRSSGGGFGGNNSGGNRGGFGNNSGGGNNQGGGGGFGNNQGGNNQGNNQGGNNQGGNNQGGNNQGNNQGGNNQGGNNQGQGGNNQGGGFGNNQNQGGNNQGGNNQGGNNSGGGFGGNRSGGFGGGNSGGGSGGFGGNNNQSGSGSGGFGNKSGGGFGGGSSSSGGGFGGTGGNNQNQPPQISSAVLKTPLGPGFLAPSTQHWAHNLDLTQLRDDILFEDLPESIQKHLKELDYFITQEKKAEQEIREIYDKLADPSAEKGYVALRKKIDRLTEGALSVNNVRLAVNRQEIAIKNTVNGVRNLQATLNDFSKNVWDPVQRKGHEYWDLKQNTHEGPSDFFSATSNALEGHINTIGTLIGELELALGGANGHADPNVGSSDSRAQQRRPTHIGNRLNRRHQQSRDGQSLATSVSATMENELELFVDLTAYVAELHALADQSRERFTRRFGDSEAANFFRKAQRDKADGLAGGNRMMGFDPQLSASEKAKQDGKDGEKKDGAKEGDAKPGFGAAAGGFGAKKEGGAAPGGFGAKKDEPAGGNAGGASPDQPTPNQTGFGASPSPISKDKSGFGSPSPAPPGKSAGFGGGAPGGFGGAKTPAPGGFGGFGKK